VSQSTLNSAGDAGCHPASPAEFNVLCDTAERARCANWVVWPVLALLEERAAWGFPELAEVERWFISLDCNLEAQAL
jgi:hypothetical protein